MNEKKEPLTLNSICNCLNQDKAKINKQIRKLIHYKEISYTEIDHEEARKFGSKRRMRLYFISEES